LPLAVWLKLSINPTPLRDVRKTSGFETRARI